MPTTKTQKITTGTFHPVIAVINVINAIIMIIAGRYVVIVKTADLLSLFSLADKRQVSGPET